MSHKAKKIMVGTARAKIADVNEGGFSKQDVSVLLKPKDGTIYLGDENVSVEDGFPLGPSETFIMDIDADLFAIAGTGTVTINGFIQKKSPR